MEFTQESIDALVVNEVDIMKKIAEELNIRVSQVSAVISLINEDCTIAFISRYRKDKTDNLNEVEVAECDHKFKSYKNLEERRLEIVRGIFGQGKLTESLYNAVMGAKTLTELEDLWAPFKKKKKTRGMVAIEKGLEPLADFMEGQNDDAAVEAEAQKFIKTDNEDAALNVESFMDAIAGAQDIIAERTSQNPQNRSDVHDLYMAEGTIETKGIVPEGVDAETAEKTSTYKMYWDYSESLNQVKPHRILAMNRAEREGALSVNINVPVDGAIALLQKKAKSSNKYHNDAIEDGLDETGKFLGFFKIFQEQNPQDAYEQINNAIDKYDIQVIAVGNGTGSQEVQAIVSKVLSENYSDSDVKYTVVDESGASVYSASPVATEEFPELDVMVRGAISMGRRLQDPLAELVKIDPKAIGVGLYQHDVNQKKLAEQLDEVVSSVVNNVGVNLNTASYMLLKYVSGINLSTAKKIVAYRDANGKIKSREELKKVPGIGPKAFEQCAGFLKIAESSDPLDNTWVHPENYEVAREVLSYVQQKKAVPSDVKKSLCEKYSVGETTLNDIIEELGKPNRDPRDGYPAPIMQKGVVNFEDLTVGMKVTGKIKNVVDFGAFVDIGLHETSLIHVSELSDNFVSDPMDVVKVGDVKEFTIIDLDKDRKRISLSLKSDAHTRLGQTNEGKKPKATDGSAPRRKVVVVKKGGEKPREAAFAGSKRSNANRGSDDGLSYNPFAAFFNNQK